MSLDQKMAVMLYATVDTFDVRQGAVPLGLAAARLLGADLTALLLNLDANAPHLAQGASQSDREAEWTARAQTNADNAAQIMRMGQEQGTAATPVVTLDHAAGVLPCITDRARLHDLLVIGTDGRGLMSDRMIAESILFETGRPLLVAPAHYSGDFSCRTVAVAWDNSRTAARALGDALALLPGIERLVLLVIGDEKAVHSSMPEDAVVATLARRNLAVSIEHRSLAGRSIGLALQESALDLGGDVLVMGGYGHSRLRDFVLGGATRTVLAKPQLPILLSH